LLNSMRTWIGRIPAKRPTNQRSNLVASWWAAFYHPNMLQPLRMLAYRVCMRCLSTSGAP
jgi:hypothetical protein